MKLYNLHEDDDLEPMPDVDDFGGLHHLMRGIERGVRDERVEREIINHPPGLEMNLILKQSTYTGKRFQSS